MEGGGRSCYLTFTTVKEEVVVAVNGDARNTVALLLFCRNIKRIKKGARDQVNEAHMYIAIIKRSQLLIRCKENHIFGPTSTVIDIYRQP